jgi:hypothetical protein
MQEQPTYIEEESNESEEISQEVFKEIQNLKIIRACTLIKRLSPPPLTPLNHFGIFV